MRTDTPGILMVESDEILLEFYEAACGCGGLQPSSRGYQREPARAVGPE